MPLIHLNHRALAGATLLLLTGCGNDEGVGGAPAGDCAVTLAPSTDSSSAFVDAVLELDAGETLCLDPGTYAFEKGVTIYPEANITVRGTGSSRDDVVLDFANQTEGDNAFEMTADGFTIENLTVKDPRGDGIKIDKSERPTFRNVRAFYTNPNLESRGAYALYPVQSTNVLIEDCEISGASDAAIYLGQSSTGVVRNNKAYDSVIGIEVENSDDVDVYGNQTWNNTTGVLIVNLPNLPNKGTERIRVFDNEVRENEHPNFGDGFAAGLSRGSGMVIMASDRVEVFGNRFIGNSGAALLVVSWPIFSLLSDVENDDPEFDQYSETVYVHDNTFTGNGQNPQDTYETPLGFTTLEDILWDGLMDPAKPNEPVEPRRLCLENNGGATFRSLGGLDGVIDPAKQSTDPTPHGCSHPALEPVVLSQP
jgi:parallel beta-helix repeat protein